MVCRDAAPQLDFGAVVDALKAQGYGDDKLEQLGKQLGFADTVTVEQLAKADVPTWAVFHLRRMLDPRVTEAKVCQCIVRSAGVECATAVHLCSVSPRELRRCAEKLRWR